MPGLPTGTVTFLFTDIEGSTQLLERLGDDRYAEALTIHQNLLRAAFAEQHGHEIATEGDSFFVVFQQACQAVSAAVAAQRAVTAHKWAEGCAVRVRMGLHTGAPMVFASGYVGLDVHRAARICAAAHGGQILVSQETGHMVEAELPPGASLRDLGSHLLKDLQQPEKVFQVLHPVLPAEFPPLRSLDAFANNLSRQLTSFIGREREIAEVKRLLRTTCLLTVTGTGGAGKTRLALQIAREVLEEYADGGNPLVSSQVPQVVFTDTITFDPSEVVGKNHAIMTGSFGNSDGGANDAHADILIGSSLHDAILLRQCTDLTVCSVSSWLSISTIYRS
jgi:class 3 adenylate cyclase